MCNDNTYMFKLNSFKNYKQTFDALLLVLIISTKFGLGEDLGSTRFINFPDLDLTWTRHLPSTLHRLGSIVRWSFTCTCRARFIRWLTATVFPRFQSNAVVVKQRRWWQTTSTSYTSIHYDTTLYVSHMSHGTSRLCDRRMHLAQVSPFSSDMRIARKKTSHNFPSTTYTWMAKSAWFS